MDENSVFYWHAATWSQLAREIPPLLADIALQAAGQGSLTHVRLDVPRDLSEAARSDHPPIAYVFFLNWLREQDFSFHLLGITEKKVRMEIFFHSARQTSQRIRIDSQQPEKCAAESTPVHPQPPKHMEDPMDIKKVFNLFFGKESQYSDDPSGLNGEDSRFRIHPAVENPPPVQAERILGQMTKAVENHIKEISVYIQYYDRSRFRLYEVVTPITPANIAALEPLTRMNDSLRKNLTATLVKKAKGSAMLDLAQFCGWRLTRDSNLENSVVYTHIAGTHPDDPDLQFEFVGEYVDIGVPLNNENKAFSEAKTAKNDTAPHFIRLTVEETGQELVIHSLNDLPRSIGRSSGCDLSIDNPYISKHHLAIFEDKATPGCVRVKLLSDKGAELHRALGEHLHLEQETPQFLVSGDILVLSPKAKKNSVRIRFDMYLSATDQKTTLIPVEEEEKPATATPDAQETLTRGDSCVSSESRSSGTLTPSSKSNPLAYIEVRYKNAELKKFPVPRLPFVIGRDPQSEASLVIKPEEQFVSRIHLIVNHQNGDQFYVQHPAYTKSGSFRANGQPYEDCFSWDVDAATVPGSASKNWIFLAGKPDESTVQVRLVKS